MDIVQEGCKEIKVNNVDQKICNMDRNNRDYRIFLLYEVLSILKDADISNGITP